MFMNENFILQNDTTNLLVPQWLPTECLVPDSVHDIGAGSSLSGVDNSSIQQVLEKLEEISTFGIGFSDVPAKWIKTARQYKLNIYSEKPYDLIWEHG